MSERLTYTFLQNDLDADKIIAAENAKKYTPVFKVFVLKMVTKTLNTLFL